MKGARPAGSGSCPRGGVELGLGPGLSENTAAGSVHGSRGAPLLTVLVVDHFILLTVLSSQTALVCGHQWFSHLVGTRIEGLIKTLITGPYPLSFWLRRSWVGPEDLHLIPQAMLRLPVQARTLRTSASQDHA